MTERWRLRTVPGDLARQYRAAGWWDDASLGVMVARGLGARAGQGFNVRSRVRPWRGTVGDVDTAARSLAGSLRAQGIGPGDVVVIQLPNWAEAGIAFWAAAYLGAVVVPVVHFYGAKEVDYILRSTTPDVVVTADHFGHTDYLDVYPALLAGWPEARWLVVGDTPDADLPRRRHPVRLAAGRGPSGRTSERRPGRAGHRGLHLGDDPRPQGCGALPPDHRL